MWHEARKQDKLIRYKMVDAAKRSERRRNYYESVRRDPTQFMQIHGRKCKIHIDPDIAKAASQVLRKWQGDPEITIDRFDVRAHLDSLCEIKHKRSSLSQAEESIASKEFWEDRESDKNPGSNRKKTESATISFSYEHTTIVPGRSKDEAFDAEEIDHLDTQFNLNKLSAEKAVELNKHGAHFGRLGTVFLDLLRIDQKEELEAKELKEIDKAKLALNGKDAKMERSRLKERRAALLTKLNQNEDATKMVLGALKREKLLQQKDSSSESEDEQKSTLIIGGHSKELPKYNFYGSRFSLTKKDDNNDGLRELKNRNSSSPDFGASETDCVKPNTSEPLNEGNLSDSDAEPLKVTSSMSESEVERREIENRKKRIRKTKKMVDKRINNKNDDDQQRNNDVAERLKRKMDKKLQKRADQMKEEERNKRLERRAEQKNIMSLIAGLKRCEFVLEKKKRRCRMLSKKGERFCGEHKIHDPNNTDRIACPNDPKHTVLLIDLEEHLKKCNARIHTDVWIEENCNKLIKDAKNELFLRPPDDEIRNMVNKVNKIYEEIKHEFVFYTPEEFHYNEIKEAADLVGGKKQLHLKQVDSIMSNLTSYFSLENTPDICLIDLGSGKAQLVYWMSKFFSNFSYLLIDRMGVRNKFDRKALKEDSTLKIERLRCSVEHLKLGNVSLLQDNKKVLAVCKHFCGVATDYGIRCLVNGKIDGVNISGFALAPCCHHKCLKNEFVGTKFLEANGISTEIEFAALRHISTWNCCGFVFNAKDGNFEMDDQDKKDLGMKAKRIFEHARSEFLRSVGYETKIIQYVDQGISPENLIILGNKR
ncbi:unnamed protein product [Bursaphelenchus okinawaensis]|uniref:tRNA:m(4)X modification enzyme TRM13 n=1 Tax=Bursaphelenchus okinawaensis TaxID=465554 RepID=A0A811LHV4_9BILA|nr:unnamed protein product [Bursaphelenchus okinawaensis]CAG9122342.1 unnamed protein product [Bursaphelenchus okinawaensis]